MYDPKNIDITSDEFLKSNYVVLDNIDHDVYETTLDAYLSYYAENFAEDETGDADFGITSLVLFEKDVKLFDRKGDVIDIIRGAVVTELSDGNIKCHIFDSIQDAKDAFDKFENKYLQHVQAE